MIQFWLDCAGNSFNFTELRGWYQIYTDFWGGIWVVKSTASVKKRVESHRLQFNHFYSSHAEKARELSMPCISFIGDIGHLGLGFGLGFGFQKQGNNQPTLRQAWRASMGAAVNAVWLPWERWLLLLFPTKAH